jgi:hypothetical protein
MEEEKKRIILISVSFYLFFFSSQSLHPHSMTDTSLSVPGHQVALPHMGNDYHSLSTGSSLIVFFGIPCPNTTISFL